LDIFGLVAGAVTVRGSFVGTRKDMAECLDFAARGKVKADIELQPLSGINTIFERLDHGDVPSRVVLDFTDTKSERAAGVTKDAVRPVPVVA
jgi:propanol-preferring alcohol dehydrogenase